MEVEAEDRQRTCKLLVARTSFLLVLLVFGAGHASFAPSLKNSGLALAPARANRSGMRPITYTSRISDHISQKGVKERGEQEERDERGGWERTISIMARCSKLSCVWKSAIPV